MPLAGILCRAALCIATGATLTFALAGPAGAVEYHIKPPVAPDLTFTPRHDVGIGRVTRASGLFSECWTLEYMQGCVIYVVENPPALPAWLPKPPSGRVNTRDFSSIHPNEEIASTTTAAGWPCRAFQCTERQRFSAQFPPAIATNVEYGWVIRNPDATAGQQLVIPYKPIWPGLLANCAIFTAAASLFTFAGAARRAYRAHRNRCPHCNYARAGLANDASCPECGRAPKQAKRSVH